jgi:AmmeMemoRadiSam system protein A
VGILEANAPVVVNVAKHAYAAAFSDTRFSPLARSEFPHIRIKISILSELEPIAFQSEQELLAQIRQGVDGLLLEEGPYRGTLLPSVWEDIPEPCDFLRRLKQKAGLSANYWSNTLTVKRYTTFCFG